jgi:hypothetical protein
MDPESRERRLHALIETWRRDAADEQRVSFCADELEAALAGVLQERQLNDIPKHLLWRLAEQFQGYRGNANEQYVKLSDLQAALVREGPPESHPQEPVGTKL